MNAFTDPRASAWTPERLAGLSHAELVNLQANATRLGEPELAALCGEALKKCPKGAGGGARPGKGMHKKLMARTSAFAARGVHLQDMRTSWSGVRKADGAVVMAIWQTAVQSRDGSCDCLLWAPNTGGSRPWSDSAAGRERLEHCRLALERGGAEALLVHGEALAGRLPEERARTVLGVDAETMIRFQVELRGGEYWACWGKRAVKPA